MHGGLRGCTMYCVIVAFRLGCAGVLPSGMSETLLCATLSWAPSLGLSPSSRNVTSVIVHIGATLACPSPAFPRNVRCTKSCAIVAIRLCCPMWSWAPARGLLPSLLNVAIVMVHVGAAPACRSPALPRNLRCTSGCLIVAISLGCPTWSWAPALGCLPSWHNVATVTVHVVAASTCPNPPFPRH